MRQSIEALAEASRAGSFPLEVAGARLLGPERASVFGDRRRSSLELRDDQLWLSLCDDMPEGLWIPVAAEHEAVQALLARYFGDQQDLSARTCVSLGLVQDIAALEDRLSDASPFCEAAPNRIDREQVSGQPSHVFAVRTLFSRSEITVRAYGALVVACVRHAPSAEASTIEAWNLASEQRCPTGLPVDVIAALQGLAVADGDTLRAALRPDQDASALVPSLLAAELAGAPVHPRDLEPLLAHREVEVRRAAVSVAGLRGYRDILEARRPNEPDASLAQYFVHYLDT